MKHRHACSLSAATIPWLWFLVWASPVAAQLRPAEKESVPPPLTHYLGRQIADTMHHSGAPWLTRDNREQEERCSLMLANLGVQRGMTVCDFGCGNGFYSLQLAKLVGPKGRVLALDVQPEMLKLLKERTAQAHLDNVVPILGQAHDAKLPADEVDLALLVDVYHELSHPEQILAALRRSLAPRGLLVLVEYRAEDPQVPIKPLHKMTKQQAVKELAANGFKLVKEYEQLPWQHMLFFGRDDTAERRQPKPQNAAAR